MFPTEKKTKQKEFKQQNLFNPIANISHKKVNWETYQELEHQTSVKLSWSKQAKAQQKTSSKYK